MQSNAAIQQDVHEALLLWELYIANSCPFVCECMS